MKKDRENFENIKTYRSEFTKRILTEEMEKKADMESMKDDIDSRYQKKMSYGKMIKEMHPPKIS